MAKLWVFDGACAGGCLHGDLEIIDRLELVGGERDFKDNVATALGRTCFAIESDVEDKRLEKRDLQRSD